MMGGAKGEAKRWIQSGKMGGRTDWKFPIEELWARFGQRQQRDDGRSCGKEEGANNEIGINIGYPMLLESNWLPSDGVKGCKVQNKGVRIDIVDGANNPKGSKSDYHNEIVDEVLGRPSNKHL
ncbi:hypothetical protein SUGI_1165790 [Cryptomeria japonica]|nr:hypothetical protein SUGI_1165790 [Cryptomeria japonica]